MNSFKLIFASLCVLCVTVLMQPLSRTFTINILFHSSPPNPSQVGKATPISGVIEKGAFVGGSLKKTVPHNDFLCTKTQFTNFVLTLKFKLVGTNGFINGGVQFRSQRVPNNFEASGYQADMGDPAWWGCLYDESRRDKVLVHSDMAKVNKVLKRNDWNDYKIRCEGKHIQLWINGVQTVDYTESDPNIPEYGIIGLQIHGGGKAEAWYKDIAVELL